jgi:hypothetical protein
LALANITISDKVKKYPGFIHPYAVSTFPTCRLFFRSKKKGLLLHNWMRHRLC